jgi:signal transduction histidine kinase
MPVEVYVRRVEFEQSDSLQWTLRDITERKDLDALREDLAAMIYHDLRSPLANIVSGLEVLSNMVDEQDESAHQILGIASHSTARIQRLVDSLLDLNRLEAGQPVADQKVVDPIALVRQAIRDVSPASEGRRQNIKTNLPERLPFLWVDAGMSHRVLVNLIENAIKFTPTEGNIEVGVKKAGDWLQFWVRDNGPGIPPAEQERIFEKFTRLRGKNIPGGLGVGLAFCRLAVQGHGGRIWVESQDGKGTVFHFTLPLATQQQIVTQESK